MTAERRSGCGGRQALPALPGRRAFLRSASCGFGMLALASLLAEELRAAPDASSGSGSGSGRPRARARSVVFCFMDGGPSHVDTFDPKPALSRHQGQPIGKGAVSKRSQSSADRVWMGSPWRFRQRGASGLWVSDLLPYIADCADDLCVVRSVVGPITIFITQTPDRPIRCR